MNDKCNETNAGSVQPCLPLTWEESILRLKKQFEQQDLVKACYYDDPLIKAAQRFYSSEEWKRVRSLMPSPSTGKKALDLGAGRGIASYALAKDGWDTTALDPDPSCIVGTGAIRQLATDAGVRITVVQEQGERLPFLDASFDVVYCRQSLHHARSLQQTCREIFRVLKPGGLFLATREHVISKDEDRQVFLDAHPLHKYYGGENAFLLKEYLFAIRSAGLRVQQILAPLDSPINYFPMSQEKYFDYCVRPLAAILGWKLTRCLFDLNHCIGKFLMSVIVYVRNRRNQTPGRLYSFIAIKSSA